ncbi:MAG: primosomal protein N' [Coriobacteriia bacterium]|nr:primosomal protein N' [Coriobacteriia bacterium]
MDPRPDIHVARVVVDVPTRALTEPFDYLVPGRLAMGVRVGAPVLVPFGGQRVVGYVVEADAVTSFQGELRDIEAVLGEPLFGEHAFALADWIAREYVCTLADALRLFLPPGGSPSAVAVYRTAGERPAAPLKGRVWDEVARAGEITSGHLRGLDQRFGAAASEMARSGRLDREWRLKPAVVGAVDDRWAELTGVDFSPRAGATAQRAVLDALSAGPVRIAELTAELGAVGGAITRLQEAGAVAVTKRRRMRTPTRTTRSAPRHETLSAGQSAALVALACAAAGSCVLLEGVTGSGKTEVYLRAIEGVIADGGSAIVLVPEISLTPQTVGRFRARFGDLVAVLHSRLAAGERYDQWDQVRAGTARVIVGPRSALFAPAHDLRLVVIDEEHEPSYKQGSAPRYHARAVAERLCSATGAVLALGSATPSMESRAAAHAGRYGLVLLPERMAGGTMPPVEVVDMAEEFRDGHRSMFSRPLTRALEDVRERGAKAVLFLNRRGFASFVLCRECGHVPRCANCSVALTYHEVGARLTCHHCGAREALPARCPKCDSPFLRQFGAGTQRVEAELRALLPGMAVVRMDADTTGGKGGHERRLAEFEELKSGILLGTQMVAKGLDYPEVELVGVINADTTLHMPDFRSGERTFQLLEQVGGRAGRGVAGGCVVVQTYWPDHPAIRAAAAHDAEIFYSEERPLRESLGYPPYGRLALVVATAPSADAARLAATAIAERLRAIIPEGWQVLGPSPAPLAKVKNAYRWHALLKAPAAADVPAALRDALAGADVPDGVAIAPDVDPLDMM